MSDGAVREGASVATRVRRAAPLAGARFVDADGNQRAAAISYRVLFSLVPFVAVLVSVLQLVLSAATEARIVSWLVGALHLPTSIEESVESAISTATAPASLAGLVSLVILLWAASGMIAAIRSAFRAIWQAESARPYIRGKLLDAALVIVAGVLVVTAFGLTLIGQSVARVGAEIAEALGVDDPGSVVGTFTEVAISAIVVFAALALLYRTVPPVPPRPAAILVGGITGTVGVLLATTGFSFYLTHFAGFDDIFGPLGAILVFLYLVYVLGIVLLFGGCVTASWPDTLVATPPGPPVPVRERMIGMVRALLFPARQDRREER